MIIIHVTIALASIILSTASALWPSRPKIYSSAGLIAATLATGTYLVISLHTPLLSICVTGLTYLAIAASGVGVGIYRLAADKVSNR